MNNFKTTAILLLVLIIAFFTIPLPSNFNTSNKFLTKEKPIPLLSKIERCLANTVYYSKSNQYTQSGEGKVSENCSKLQSGLKIEIENNNISEIKRLISKGANVNSPNNDYDLMFPIVVAVKEENPKIVKLLLDNGADSNQVYTCCMSSESILMMAIKNNDFETTQLLLSRRANHLFMSEYSGKDVFDVVAENGNFKIFKLMDNACGIDILCRFELRFKLIYENLIPFR